MLRQAGVNYAATSEMQLPMMSPPLFRLLLVGMMSRLSEAAVSTIVGLGLELQSIPASRKEEAL